MYQRNYAKGCPLLILYDQLFYQKSSVKPMILETCFHPQVGYSQQHYIPENQFYETYKNDIQNIIREK